MKGERDGGGVAAGGGSVGVGRGNLIKTGNEQVKTNGVPVTLAITEQLCWRVRFIRESTARI